jgi:hypothetical protein
MHFFLNSFLQQSVFCRCHLPPWLRRAAAEPPPPLWSVAAATQLLHIEVIVELLPRCSVPLARSHRGRRQADARSFAVLLIAPFLGSLCYSPRHVLSGEPLDAAVPLVGRHRPSSCFALPPLSMPSYHDVAQGEREVGGGAALGRVGTSGRLGRRAEQLARGERELEAVRSSELRVARHSGQHIAACSGWRSRCASVCECTPFVGDCHCLWGRLFTSYTVEFASSNCIPHEKQEPLSFSLSSLVFHMDE